jgi:predicted kinase
MSVKRSLVLLRGLPGSGKSTLAALLSEEGKYPVFSVDEYFTDENGNYNFEFQKNHMAYKSCESRVRNAMEEGRIKIFVDNTFTLDWELEPYFKLASEQDYRLFVVTVENYHGGVNQHEISDEQLKKMASKYKISLLFQEKN